MVCDPFAFGLYLALYSFLVCPRRGGAVLGGRTFVPLWTRVFVVSLLVHTPRFGLHVFACRLHTYVAREQLSAFWWSAPLGLSILFDGGQLILGRALFVWSSPLGVAGSIVSLYGWLVWGLGEIVFERTPPTRLLSFGEIVERPNSAPTGSIMSLYGWLGEFGF